MGTNYYLKTDFCPCCGKPRKTVHLGKSSHGWKFLIHKQGRVKDFESLKSYIQLGIIEDEYGYEHSKDDFLDLIDAFQEEKSNPDSENIGGYDFLEADFC